MREELRERARKINSLVFKAKTCTSTVVQPSSSPGPSSSNASLDVSSNSAAVGSWSSDLASSHYTPSTSSCQQKEKKKKRKKDKKFEGTRVPHLTKVRPYRPPAEFPSPEGEEEDSEDSKQERKKATDAAAQDDYVLAKLFAKSGGVHSALRHDAIVDDDAADHALLEAEAAQAAKAAVRALRDSRRAYAAPTSSAAAGSSGRFGKKKKTTSLGGNGATNQLMTSADLLARIRARNKVVVTAAAVEREEEGEEESLFFPTATTTAAAGGGGGEEGRGAQQSELLTDIRNFIAFQVRKQCWGSQ
jgi:hypothetical protein